MQHRDDGSIRPLTTTIRYFLTVLFLIVAGSSAYAQVTGCTAAQMADDGSFSISGSNLVVPSGTPLSAARDYSVCVIDTMNGVTNSNVGWPLTVHVTAPTGPAITVNGQPSGAQVAPGASITVAVSGGPANPGDWIGLCNSNTTCNYGTYDYYDWSYLNCSPTQPTFGQAAASCSLHVPSVTGTYYADFISDNGSTHSIVAYAPFTVTSGSAGPSISLNTSNPSPGSIITVTFSGAPASGQTAASWVGICNTGTPSQANCDGAGYDWDYLGNPCSRTAPGAVVNSPTACTLTVPNPTVSGTYNYQVVWFPGLSSTTSCAPGNVGPCPGSILPPCPRGCSWAVVYNDDFTSDTTFDYALNPDVTHGHPGAFDTNHKWEIPPDGSLAEESPSATEACTSMIDTSTLPGYLSIHAVGTVGWETPGALVCTEMAPVAGAAGVMPGTQPSGCGFDCGRLTGPVYYEAKIWAAPNQIFESILSNICTSADKGRPCSPITTRPQFAASNMFWNFFEARGNNTDTGGNFTQIFNDSNHSDYIYGPTEGWFANVGSGALSPSPHVMGYLIDPNGAMAVYWDGVQTFSRDVDFCATGPATTCFANLPVASWWWFDWASMTGTPGGTSKVYFVRAYGGQ